MSTDLPMGPAPDYALTEDVWATPRGYIRVGDRVIVVTGRSSDMPDYRGATGTVLRLFERYVEVELDHYGYATLLDPLRLEVTP